tara:strand:- start:230 stop:463 length:234 start_codon:yes stop_codon:yes gene_type:complete
MSQGCPVIISNKSALTEINSDAVEYFDPDNENEIKNSMYKVLFDENYRKKIIKKSQNHYKKFSWKKTVSETLRVLDY